MQTPKNRSMTNGLRWGEPETLRTLEEYLMDTEILPRPRGNRGGKKQRYYNALTAFDIETTNLKDIEQSFMYVWQWAFTRPDPEAEIFVVYGRTWEEWQECRDFIISYLEDEALLVVLDHNLSFEFQFLTEYYDFSADEVFAVDYRKPIKCTMLEKLEYRCTFAHSNTSLKVYLQQWNAEHQKLSGDEFDYDKERWPDTELSEVEMKYALHDVIGLCEAYRNEMNYHHDDLYSIPMTSTGYVRRDCKKAWNQINFYDRVSWMPDYTVTKLLMEAFRGGDTHGNRLFATMADRPIINENVHSVDRSSSYPDVLINCMYPLGNWYRLGKKDQIISLADYEKFVYGYERAVVGRVHFEGLRLKKRTWAMPYISKSKCGYVDNYSEDNGRIYGAWHCSLTITDVDWQIIKQEYEWDTGKVYFTDCWYCRYRYLPDFFRDVVRDYYEKKTALKGSPDGSLEEIEYRLSKALLNALYGMAAQKPIKENLCYDHLSGDYILQSDMEIMEKEEEIKRSLTEREKREIHVGLEKELLEKTNKIAFMPFSVGVWVTAWARLELHRMMWEVDSQGGFILYCDTDSVKYIGDVDTSRLNSFYTERSTKNRAFATDRKGITHYMGVYELEYTAKQFAHMGAKKYVYTTEPNPNGKTWADQHGFHITIAGVEKDKGAKELYEHGGFKAFKDGMKFTDAGGTACVYNDHAYGWYEKDGRKIWIGRNIYLCPDFYTLGLAPEYRRCIEYWAINHSLDEKDWSWI